MINSLKDLKFSKNAAKFFRKARAERTFPFPSTLFLPAPPERFGVLRNAAGVSLKKGSRIFNYSPPEFHFPVFDRRVGGRRTAPPIDFGARHALRGSPSAGSKSFAVLVFALPYKKNFCYNVGVSHLADCLF